jgi:hypothetical protein
LPILAYRIVRGFIGKGLVLIFKTGESVQGPRVEKSGGRKGRGAVVVTRDRVGVTGPEEAISISVTGVWTQLAAAITLLRAALLALRIIAVSGFVFK